MNSEVSGEKSRRNASRLPSESKPLSLRLNSGNRQHKSEQDNSSRHWTLTSEGFPPGVTVDELKHYRRRRQIDVKDRDGLRPEEECQTRLDRDAGKDETKKTEDKPIKETYFPRERPVLKRPQGNLHLAKDQPMDCITEKSLKYIPFSNVEKRKLLRRSTALKPEGEMTAETEVRSQFKPYENPEKVQPIRRPPSLKLEGEFETLTTEQREKFINHIFGERLVLRKNTLLKMEGDFDFLTEKQVSYVPHEAKERPFLRKRSTSLKLDGEVEFFPEYRSSYVDFPRTRPITYKPMENLRNEGELEVETETKTKFIDFQKFPVSLPAKPPNNILIEGGFDIRPEYKENYIDFPRTRPFTIRPENHLKQEGDFDLKTEKEEELSKILSEDLKRPLMVRRQSNLKLEGDLEFSTEKREQFKGHDLPERLPPPRRDGNLHLEGQMDFKTEMEEKYVANPTAELTDFRRKSSFLQSGGEFRSVLDYDRTSRMTARGAPLPSPNRSRVFEDQTIRSKLIPFKTEHYNSEIVENCNRRSSRKNSKRLKENITDPFPRDDSADVEKFPVRRLPPSDNLRLESELHSICRTPPERKTHFVERDQSDDTSDTASMINHQPSFRLEVYNVDAQPQGFHRGTQRVFPPEGIPTETLSLCPDSFLEKKRSEYYGRSVNSPEVPTYILDKNNNVGGKPPIWDVPRKTDDRLSPPDAAADGESWSRPNWLTT